MKPLAIDLFCGLGGWTEGLLAEGYEVVGFDIEQHVYGDHRYPARLVLQDVTTLHGSQFKNAALIVASPPCQAYSYRAMPWKRAKALPPPSNELFDACFRIQREAIEAAGHFIPLVVENVCGAQKWVGRARWHYGSFYLWGDVPALMPTPTKRVLKDGVAHRSNGETNFHASAARASGTKVSTMGAGWHPPGHPKHVAGLAFNGHAERAIKNDGGSWLNIAHNTTSGVGNNPDGRKVGGSWCANGDYSHPMRSTSSTSTARKAASAMIAKIPLPLSRHVAAVWKPKMQLKVGS